MLSGTAPHVSASAGAQDDGGNNNRDPDGEAVPARTCPVARAKCMARTWSGDVGRQCERAQKVGEYCGIHAASRKHGRIDEPLPAFMGAAKPDSRPRAPAVCAASAAGVDLGAHIGGAIRLKYMSGRRAGQVRTVTLVRKIRLAGGPAWKVREVWGEEYDYYEHHMRDLVVLPDS